ncbi:metal-dependent hydrolase [uncultured Xylophilus sp.]|uniref:metal-dependent hydrolase n=1 Tax=uncultured Xylophilus sp. TaxID=296832 RepID=UPI0025E87698|nr:metal-dependent hydrolase [uncultured Xylophilus sp.]
MHDLTPAPERLLIRKLEIDLKRGFGRHWHGGDVFRTQFFNALSMSFPVGEQFFIDAVREAAKLLPDTAEGAALRETVSGFVGQEATHRHIHGLYNAHLEKQGLDNQWQHWAEARLARMRARWPDMDKRHALAATCAFEHLTALLADGTLRHDRWLEGAEPDMQVLWRWHAAEETEHRAVAFAVYRALGGDDRWRRRWYVYVCLTFLRDATRQTLLNLRRDGTLWRLATWREAASLFFGRDGLLWRTWRPALAYFRRDFHPDRETAQPTAQALARDWLAAHAMRFRVVGGPR